MSKSRFRTTASKSSGGRVVSTPHLNANRRPLRLPPLTVSVVSPPLSVFEDRRSWHPDTRVARPAFSMIRGATQVVPRQRSTYNAPSQTKARLTFAAPEKVLVCVRRERRKEVLFAKGVGGSAMKKRRPRRNYWSSVSCKK